MLTYSQTDSPLVILRETATQHQLILPRGLIFLAGLWIIGSFLLAMGLRTPIHATAVALEPSIRLMLQTIAVGLVVGWPLLRLSQQRTSLPLRQTLLDLISLLTMLQVVVWVPRIFTVWSVSRTAAMDAMLSSWAVLIGAVIAAVIATDRVILRTIAMVVCVAILMIGPVLLWSGAAWLEFWGRDLIVLGPFMGVSQIAQGGATRADWNEWQAIMVIASAGVLSWSGLAIMSALCSRRDTQSTQQLD